MAKRAATKTTVTKTSPTTKTITRRDAPPPKKAVFARPVTRTVVPAKDPAPAPAPTPPTRTDTEDAPVDPVKADPDVKADAKRDEPLPAGVTSHDDNQALLEQLNGQLGAIRGLPQYAEAERELTERIAALSAPPVKA